MSLAQGRVDCIADRAGLKFNLLAGESQHSNSLFHHPLITNGVVPLALFRQMTCSVNFDNQFCFEATKVGRIFAERMLPPEFNLCSAVDCAAVAIVIARTNLPCGAEIVRTPQDP